MLSQMLEQASRDPDVDHRRGGEQGEVKRVGEGDLEQVRDEASCDINVDEQEVKTKRKEVKLFIPRSKADQQAKGALRTLQCCGEAYCDALCPWNLAVGALSCLTNKESPLFPTRAGTQISKEQMVRAWQNDLNPRMSGQSGRRSGAMMYTRRGLGIYDTSFLKRWKSSAVLRRIEDALEEIPLNRSGGRDRTTVATNEAPVVTAQESIGNSSKQRKFEQKGDTTEENRLARKQKVEQPMGKSQLFAVSTNRELGHSLGPVVNYMWMAFRKVSRKRSS